MNAILFNPDFIMLGQTLGKFFGAAQKTLSNYGMIITSLIGVAMVIVGIFQLAKNLISHGKGQTNWVVTIALIIVGATLAISGGWRFIGNIGQGGKSTLSMMALGNADTTGNTAMAQDPFDQGNGTQGGGGSH